MTSSGTDQTSSSTRPENDQSGKYVAFVLPARNHQAKPSVARMVGTTIASMIASELSRMVFSPAATGPAGSSTPVVHEHSRSGNATMTHGGRKGDSILMTSPYASPEGSTTHLDQLLCGAATKV